MNNIGSPPALTNPVNESTSACIAFTILVSVPFSPTSDSPKLSNAPDNFPAAPDVPVSLSPNNCVNKVLKLVPSLRSSSPNLLLINVSRTSFFNKLTLFSKLVKRLVILSCVAWSSRICAVLMLPNFSISASTSKSAAIGEPA